jgi:serine/threonine protein kinase
VRGLFPDAPLFQNKHRHVFSSECGVTLQPLGIRNVEDLLMPDPSDHHSGTVHDHFFLGHLQSVQGENAWYYNQRFLGRGGNGTAFLVTCSSGPNTGMQFVLKVFHKISNDKRRQKFLKEIAHLRSLDHPAITRVFDEGTFKSNTGVDYPFAIIEYVPVTARALLLSKQIDRLRAIRIALNCLSAIGCLHKASPPLIHRDIKPENILISEMGAKLADFGLVKVLTDLESASDEDAFEGTQWPGMPWHYRTPELVKRANDHKTLITPKSDIFQFGTVFYELLTGFNPQLPPKDLTEPINLDLREIRGNHGQELSDLVEAMLAEKPSNRLPAHACMTRLNKIHEAYCGSLFEVTGQFV